MISIILPTYNESAIIHRMLDDLIRYVPPPMEVIVVDDDSPDQTWQIIKIRVRPKNKK